MRFQQLNRDPNNTLRKKLVKSKKNWIVVSSLALAGGLFLATSPSMVVKADDNDQSATIQTSQSPNNTANESPANENATKSDPIVQTNPNTNAASSSNNSATSEQSTINESPNNSNQLSDSVTETADTNE